MVTATLAIVTTPNCGDPLRPAAPRLRSSLQPDALAHRDHAAGADREAFAVLLEIHPDHFAGPDHDVFVQDRVAYHGAAADPSTRHDHAALDDRSVVDHNVRRQHRV